MIEATMTSKGQVTIPKDIREHLGLHPGSTIVFDEQGRRVFLQPKVQPKIQNPLHGLMALRQQFEEEGKLIPRSRLKEMLKEEKKQWSKII